ncbi:UNVERIFIED_CONTAM: hypothetical protein GTU68_064176 [Idotea baltica]|nr:hypothetical protein [Idotea baltica]
MGFEKPTEIQEQAIPQLLSGFSDFIGLAQTGTGKTAAFGLPLLERIDPSNKATQALVLAPTRELGQQIAEQLKTFSKYQDKVNVLAVYGGAAISNQMKALRKPTQVIIATPGRLIDLIKRKAVFLDELEYLVLDEADEMLNMGFKKEIDKILSYTPEHKLTWLFSATMPAENVAARGIDVNDLTHVFHYTLPDDEAYYTHRSGRTARAGKKGTSISFINGREGYKIRELQKKLKIEIDQIEIPAAHDIASIRIEKWAETIANTEQSERLNSSLVKKVNKMFSEFTKEDLVEKLLSIQLEQLNLGSNKDLNTEKESSDRGRGGRGGRGGRSGGGRGGRRREYGGKSRSGGGKSHRKGKGKGKGEDSRGKKSGGKKKKKY